MSKYFIITNHIFNNKLIDIFNNKKFVQIELGSFGYIMIFENIIH